MQKNEISHRSLFVGRDLALDYHDGGHPISIVTFESRNKDISSVVPSAFSTGYGRGVFAPLGLNEFLVKRSRNHWYQTEEIEEVIELIREHAKGTSIITYGGSMGGMAAVSFANKLEAKKFIALSPLYDIEPGGEVEDNRWPEEGANIDFRYNYIRTGECRQAQGYVFYCPDSVDVDHARCIERMTEATIVPLEYGGHPVSFFLNDTYKLKRLVSEIARDEFDLGRFNEVVHANTAQTYYPYERQANEYARTDKLDSAIRSMRTAESLNPRNARLPFKLGEFLFKQGNIEEAQEAYQRSISIDAKFAPAHVRLSHVHSAGRRLTDAVESMKSAIRLAPTNSDFHLRLGELQLKAGFAREAQSSMTKAIEHRHGFHRAYVRLSYAHAALEQWAEAIDAVRSAVQFEPENADYYLRLGEWQLKAAAYSDAEQSMKTAISMAADNANYRVRLSYVFAAQKKYERAAAAMDRAIQFRPGVSAYHMRLGECLLKSGEWLAAEKAMQRALQLNPDDALSRERLHTVQATIARKEVSAG